MTNEKQEFLHSPNILYICTIVNHIIMKIIQIIIAIGTVLFLNACGPKPQLVNPEGFVGKLDAVETGLYTLRSSTLTMQVTNFGGRVVSLFVPDKNGNLVDVILGHNTLDEYVHPKRERFLCSVVGPVANRICNATYTYDGQTYNLCKNHSGKGTLHGGFKGLDSVVWDVVEVTKSSIVLHYLHADGTEGFPGNLHIYMTYTLKDGTWRIDYSAQTDKTRPVNISNHPYFNLSGEGNGTCHDYIMYVNADKFVGTSGLDVLEELIPLDGTVMDYRKPHRVGDALESDDPFIKRSNTGFDHNYCINGNGFRKAASLYNPSNGIFLEVYSDQPGLQLYSGQWINGKEIGKCGKPLERYSSFTFETQNYPDAPNKPSFPNPFLKPGEEYTHTCEYRFSVN